MDTQDRHDEVLVILGNQLFPLQHLEPHRDALIFMAEDQGLCTYVHHHQQKIVFFLAAMRSYRDALVQHGFAVHYELLDTTAGTYEASLGAVVEAQGARGMRHFEIEDKPMGQRLTTFAAQHGLRRQELSSPMFLCSRQRFAAYIENRKRPLMADFYQSERRRQRILVEEYGRPVGGRWSFDVDNRRKLPKHVTPPAIESARHSPHTRDVIERVQTLFPHHPGQAAQFWWPVTRRGALDWLAHFLNTRLADFGPYEDAITQRSATVYHSVLSPLLNMGLLTPDEVIERSLAHAQANNLPLASIEGLARQIVGWREFIHGIYRHYDERQWASNHWSHQRALTDAWYHGTTGIAPLDDTIHTARDLGWAHHIQRLMVVSNLMTLCEIHPHDAWRWFMEMFVDSSEWVMGPNVFGMGLYSDGGIFATKPYICGSNYLCRMSDYRKGPWCDVVDGLYWRFIARHRDYFMNQPRLALMPKMLDRLQLDRRHRIFAAAEQFLERHTTARI